jgi:predicted DNA-binding transcriptional regulator AlpA
MTTNLTSNPAPFEVTSASTARLLNAEELADRLGLKVSTIYAITSGRTLKVDIPPWIYVGRYPRWSEEDVQRWISEKQRHHPATSR